MALTYSSFLPKGTPAPDFHLKGVDERLYSLKDFLTSETKALVVIFMCNHCPYVIAVQERINALAQKYSSKGVKLVGINSNDVEHYPEDSFEKMQIRSKEQGYVFPYLIDETQEVAKAYQAECTPDPYLFERVGDQFLLRYQGRIDDSWKEASQVKHEELQEAIEAVLNHQEVNPDQKPSMGCNIKWKK